MTRQLVLASHNLGKLREFGDLLAPLGWQIISQADLGISEAEEPYETFIENALAKARHAARQSGLPALADDSGLCVPALQNAPGVHSARYAGVPKDDARNNQKLIDDLRALEAQDWRAFYVAALVLVRSPQDPLPVMVEARWWGRVIETAQGEGGFGYDPHFFVDACGFTAAQLEAGRKNQLSHRGQASRMLIDRMRADGW